MGTLIQFNQADRPRRPRERTSAPAEILIYTGVRYERAPAGVQTPRDPSAKPS